MFCKGCGKSVDTSAAICPHCGREIDSLSGGTGFWDLLEQTPERRAPHESPGEETCIPAGEAQLEQSSFNAIEGSMTYDEIPEMTHTSNIARRQTNPTRRRTAPPNGAKPFAVGIVAVVCVLIAAVALILSHCSHVGEESGIAEDGQLESSAASEWNGANDEESGEDGQGASPGDSEGNDGSMGENSGSSRRQSNPFPGYQSVTDNGYREIGGTESAYSSQDQASEQQQQQEEGTRNGQ